MRDAPEEFEKLPVEGPETIKLAYDFGLKNTWILTNLAENMEVAALRKVSLCA